MMLPEFLQPSWPYTSMDFSICKARFHSLNSVGLCSDVNSFEFCSSMPSRAEDSSVSSTNQYSLSAYSNVSCRHPSFDEDLLVKSFLNLQESTDSERMEWESKLPSLEDSEDDGEASLFSIEILSNQVSLILPDEGTNFDNQLCIFHLLKSYREAIENEMIELGEVILARLEEKACLGGETVQRLLYYLIQSLDHCGGYLKHELAINYMEAFLAVYQIFPYGKFTHFSANSMIMDSLPDHAEIIHIVDFDMGEGVQWAPLIESLGRKLHQGVVKLKCIKWEGKDCDFNPFSGRFEKTKKVLMECAYYSNVRLEVEEIIFEGLVSELKNMNKNGGIEWLAFNCMVNLPHMGRIRSEKHIVNFLNLAKESISGNRGILTFGDGILEGGMKECSGLGPFLEGQFGHFHGLIESMNWYFPSETLEARVVMECLFVAPYVSSLACLQKWEERECGYGGKGILGIGLERLKVSEDCVAEAKELVRQGENLYWVKSENSFLVLGYMGTPLVQVSCWRTHPNL